MEDTVLVVDDRPTLRRALASELDDAGFRVVEAEDGGQAWDRFRAQPPDLVITDLVMPRAGGLELLARIRSESPIPVIVFTAQADVETAVEAMKRGADDFVSSADGIDALVALARRFASRGERSSRSRIAERLVGDSASMQRLRDRLEGLVALGEPVLLAGEPGTGRSTAARLLHDLGPASSAPFVEVDGAGAFPATLPLRGTIYLRDVGRVPPAAQPRWEEVARRARADGPRVVASATPALALRVRSGEFHAGLGRSLLRFEVLFPPLRDRPEDIPRVANFLLAGIARELSRPDVTLRPDALARLRGEPWPGNANELEEVLSRLVAFATAREIHRHDVEEVLAECRPSLAALRERAAVAERERLVSALEQCGGNVTRTAERLGRSRAAIYRLVDKHGVSIRRR
jgi:DNA-binding NtrC family response regulator